MAQTDRLSDERLYLHTNKDLYIPGEIAWFSVYSYLTPGYDPFEGEERVAYVDLLSADGTKVLDSRIALGSDHQHGSSVFIPGNLNSGDYWLLAYTDAGASSGTAGIYRKKIRIINPMESSFRNALTVPRASFVIHPEGGNLVEGVNNRISYYLNGLGIEQFPYTLYVETEGQEEVFEFVSNASGAGVFSFSPRKGESYRSYIRFKDGSYMDVNLPPVVNDKPGLRVERVDGDHFKVTAFWNDQFSGHLQLKVLQFGRVLESRNVAAGGTSYDYTVALPDSLSGSFWFELWNNDRKVASRLVFHGRPETVMLPVTFPVTSNFGVRESGKLSIQTSAIGQAATFSVSIYLKGGDELLPGSQYHNLTVDRWLYANGVRDDGGEMAERIWFAESSHFDALDPYVMAQRPEDSTGPATQDHEMDSYRTIQFQISNQQSNQPRAHEYFFLSFPGKTERLYLSKTDANGIAKFVVDPVFGRHTAVLVSHSGQAFDMKVVGNDLSGLSFPGTAQGVNSETGTEASGSISAETEEWIASYSIHVQAENAYFRRERAVFDQSAVFYKAPFYGHADRTYRLDDYTRFVLMEEVLREYMPEVSVVRRAGRYGLRVHDQRRNLFFEQGPLVLFDGVPVTDIDKIIAYDPRKIEEISVIGSTFFYGPLEFHGVVSFKTYDGDMKDLELERDAVVFDYDGYHLERRFFSPDYTEEAARYPASIPDFRNVLLWNGAVHTSGTEDLILDFSTSDLKGEYIVEIEGMDHSGRVLKGRSSLNVR